MSTILVAIALVSGLSAFLLVRARRRRASDSEPDGPGPAASAALAVPLEVDETGPSQRMAA
jgi:hypothetical protein